MKIEFNHKNLVINYLDENNKIIESVEYYETFDDLEFLLERLIKDVKNNKDIVILHTN